jgi:hypothetical protein
MDQEPKYPVGIQEFDELRHDNYLYVDKTALVYKLTHTYKLVFLSRPRRFGKSLLTSTLQCYFEGRKELFTGLAMDTLEKEWTAYPVLHFDFGGLKAESADKLEDSLNVIFKNYETIYGADPDETSIGIRFAGLMQRAYQQTGQRVVLLIDEYGAPILEVLLQPDLVKNVRRVMREFYSQIKPCGKYLRFVFLTGISTFSQLGMFSELNNLFDITDLDEYAALCGITPQELTDNFQQGIQRLAEKEECTPQEMVERLREQYDGYHFTNSLVDVFNPYSLLNAFARGALGDYWFQTGTPSFVIDMIREHKGDWEFNIEDIENTEPMSLSDFSTPLEQADDPIPFLYQAGYLTIKSYSERGKKYVLGVPNTEVRIGLLKNLIPLYTSINPKKAYNVAGDISLAFGEGDYDKAFRLVQAFMAGIPAMRGDNKLTVDLEASEAYYHRILFIIFHMLHDDAWADVPQAIGKPDIVVKTRKYIYIIEVKLNSSPDVALDQIETKQYVTPYLMDKREIIKLGVTFSSLTRTLAEWKRRK